MKISKIEQEGYIFYVTTAPNFFQRLFGKGEKTHIIKDQGMYVGRKCYIENYKEIPSDHPLVVAIDEFRNKK